MELNSTSEIIRRKNQRADRVFRRREQMIRAVNFIKEILIAIYQVLILEAKERYKVTEFYLEKCCCNEKSKEKNLK